MGIPRHTRIVLIPDDERSTREYGISRAMVVVLILLAATLFAGTAFLMVFFANRAEDRQTIIRQEQELVVAREAVASRDELAARLEATRRLQEQLLTMLGVEGGGEAVAESLAVWQHNRPDGLFEQSV